MEDLRRGAGRGRRRVVAFGFVLLGVKIANSSGTTGARGGGSRVTGLTLSAVCGVICIGVVVIGVYAMTKKPKSKPAAKPKTALIIQAAPRPALIASIR